MREHTNEMKSDYRLFLYYNIIINNNVGIALVSKNIANKCIFHVFQSIRGGLYHEFPW